MVNVEIHGHTWYSGLFIYRPSHIGVCHVHTMYDDTVFIGSMDPKNDRSAKIGKSIVFRGFHG